MIFLHAYFAYGKYIILKVLVRNIPPDTDESVGELVEHFFLVNHPDNYLTHQVGFYCIHYITRILCSLIFSLILILEI